MIFDTRAVIDVRTPAQWKQKQDKVIAKAKSLGMNIPRTTVKTPVFAYVNHNRWIIDCPCGGGIAVHPGWHEAYCLGLGCARVYVNVVFPEDREAIEKTLGARPAFVNRNWNPGETVDMLRADNAERGIK